jgi:hypothetical protein
MRSAFKCECSTRPTLKVCGEWWGARLWPAHFRVRLNACHEICECVSSPQARIELTAGQAEEMLAGRRTLLREVGSLIAEWDRLWADLQVGPSSLLHKQRAAT